MYQMYGYSNYCPCCGRPNFQQLYQQPYPWYPQYGVIGGPDIVHQSGPAPSTNGGAT